MLLLNEIFGLFNRLGGGLFKWTAYFSYSMYLYHIIALRLLGDLFAPFSPSWPLALLHAIVFAAATFLVGGLSYAFVERPFLLLKQRLSRPASARAAVPQVGE